MNICDRQSVGDSHRYHCNQLRGVLTNYGTTQHNTGRGVGHNFHESPGIIVDQSLGGRCKRHFGDSNLSAHREGVGFGQTDVSDLGFGEDSRSGLVVVEVAMGANRHAHDVLTDLAALHGGDR